MRPTRTTPPREYADVAVNTDARSDIFFRLRRVNLVDIKGGGIIHVVWAEKKVREGTEQGGLMSVRVKD
jgi:hypothetical protein